MTCRPVAGRGLPALLVLVLAAAPAAAQSPTELFERKQAFVAALRQFSISIAGRFGDEGSRLAADADAMAAALRAWDESIAAFERTLRQRRLAADDYVALGMVQLDRARAAGAVRSFGAAAKLAPSRADIQQMLAMAHGRNGQRAEAVRALTRAATLEPQNVVVRYELARHAMETRTPPNADTFSAFQAAAAPHLARGATIAFASPGLLRQTAGVAPIFPPAAYVQVFDAIAAGRFDEAVAGARGAIAADVLVKPGVPAAVAAGSDALRSGDVTGALRQLTAAVAATPESAEAHRALGTAYRLDDQLDRSLYAYATAVRLTPANERARLAQADVLIDMDRLDDAGAALRETIRAIPGSVLAHYRLGRLLQARGLYAEAVTELKTAARSAPLVGQDPLHEMVALLLANQADFEGAVEALQLQIAVNPGNADAHRRLGDSYVRLGRNHEALAAFTAARLVDPRNVAAIVGVAQLHLTNGAHAEAAEAARAAIALDTSHAQARYVLGTALTRLGRAGEAGREMDEYRRLQAAAAEASKQKLERDGLARQIAVLTTAGSHQEAVPLLKQLSALEPAVASHRIALGQALTASGQASAAIEAYRAAAALDPADPDVHRYLAEAYLAAGETDASRQEAARYRESIDRAKRQRALRYGNP